MAKKTSKKTKLLTTSDYLLGNNEVVVMVDNELVTKVVVKSDDQVIGETQVDTNNKEYIVEIDASKVKMTSKLIVEGVNTEGEVLEQAEFSITDPAQEEKDKVNKFIRRKLLVLNTLEGIVYQQLANRVRTINKLK